ncbi:vitamin K epoxide reductase/DsbA family protein [Anaeromyxobacter diazotrophicus]|uniref:Thioredoxin domain-containing protein n=1 Tax=Anaeromyxobacter diazotrophicus TaxID=2590199 RepID=A0A7I9VP64_9BACT|nr:vitamin K epoxide reductase family protein [Anaeromyxobacter diazotrophicus]GEJ57747.1 hypothetical protein AMYX_24880 [Anaeromyxobacter diazotrophicus]
MKRSKPPPTRPSRRAGGLLYACLAAAGLALALLLARVHAQAVAGAAPSFCSLGETVNCDRVALSPYSVVLGVPIALWGAFAYAVMLLLALAGLRRRGPSSWPAGLSLLLAGAAAALTVPLAFASAFLLRSLCLLCAATWAIDWALFATALRGARAAGGPAQAVAQDLRLLAQRPWRSLAVSAAAGALLAAALAAYASAVAASAAARPAPTASAPPPPPPPAEAGSGPAGVTIFEFSDYECPHCARAHAELRAALKSRPAIRLEHRNFPLDQACNPAVTRPFHRKACALARAALCAGEQGRFWELNDALFANQTAGRPVEELAAEVGLDVAALRRCQDAPETARRLDEEIAAGLRAGVNATPTYVVGRALYVGAVPAAVLGPPR